MRRDVEQEAALEILSHYISGVDRDSWRPLTQRRRLAGSLLRIETRIAGAMSNRRAA
jgi:hypothetical protein